MTSKLHRKPDSFLKIKKQFLSPEGFTLLEIIMALILISVMAAMIFHITGGGLWRSAKGVSDCRIFFEVQGQMERITKTYKQQLAANNGVMDLAAFQSTISGWNYVDATQTGYLSESGGNLSLTPGATPLFMVTLVHGDQRCVSLFSQ